MRSAERKSRTLRFMAYVYGSMCAWSWYIGTVPEAYVAMFSIIGVSHGLAAEIMKELGR